jgi:L,D-transpeptidase catalytic domain
MKSLGRRKFLKVAAFGGAALAFGGLGAVRSVAAPLSIDGMTPGLMQRALTAFDRHGAAVTDRRIMAVADFALSSGTPRFHLIDRMCGNVATLLVAHGKGSDPAHSGFVQSFSNIPGSEASSNGAYVTSDAYVGQHGLSRRLIGLDPQNDAAEARAIVIHRAAYVSAAMAETSGKIGRSQGCFAFADCDIDQVLWQLPAGSFLFADKL